MLPKLNNSVRLYFNVLLAAFIFILFFLNAYNKTYNARPMSIHQWRQTDCLSITKNYYEEGMRFFNPTIHWQGQEGGKAVSECPILNYTVAALWKIFGEKEFIYRFLEYFIFVVSMIVLFNTLFRFYGSGLLSFFFVSLLLTSPLLVYYSFNFIADVPALSFCILCFCYFFRFYKTKELKYFYFSLILGTLAILLKASAAVGLGTLLIFSLSDLFNLTRLLKTEKLFNKKTIPALSIFLSLLVVASWYKFAINYNKTNNGVFLLTVLPIWEMKKAALVTNARALLNEFFPLFFNKGVYLIFIIMVCYVLANFKKLDSFLKYTFILSGLFFALYLLFFFQVFNVHDYYLVNLMIFPVITFFCVSDILSRTTMVANNKRFFMIAVVVLVTFNALYGAATYRARMVNNDRYLSWYPFISNEEKKFSEWLLWHHQVSMEPLETITPELRKIGITRNNMFLSIPDESWNITLYLMDQKGRTVPSKDFSEDTAHIHSLLEEKKYEYLLLSDTSLKQQNAFRSVSEKLDLLLTKQNMQVFRIKN